MSDKDYLELIHKAQKYGSQEKWDECIKCYERAFKIYIKEDDLLDCGLAYLENDNSFRAVQTIDAVIISNDDYYKGHYYKGIYFETIENIAKALEEYKKALDRKIDNNQEKAEIVFKIGKIEDDQNNITEAIKYYHQALEIDDSHFFSSLNLGSLYERQNKLKEALKYTNQALQINPKMKMASYNLGVIYGKLEKYDEAKKCYLEEVSKEDFYPYAYYNLGIIYKDYDKNLEEAKKNYLQALQYLKTDCNVWYNLGCCHVLLNDYSNATDCFYGAIIINKKVYEFLSNDDEIKSYLNTEEFKRLEIMLNKKD